MEKLEDSLSNFIRDIRKGDYVEIDYAIPSGVGITHKGNIRGRIVYISSTKFDRKKEKESSEPNRIDIEEDLVEYNEFYDYRFATVKYLEISRCRIIWANLLF